MVNAAFGIPAPGSPEAIRVTERRDDQRKRARNDNGPFSTRRPHSVFLREAEVPHLLIRIGPTTERA